MKATDFVHCLQTGQLDKVFEMSPLDVGRLLARVVMPQKEFLLCLDLMCGCKRLVHYDIGDMQLVVKADGAFYYQYVLHPTLTFAPHDRPCDRRIVIADASWGNLPTIGIKVSYTHHILDRVMRESDNYVREDGDVPQA